MTTVAVAAEVPRVAKAGWASAGGGGAAARRLLLPLTLRAVAVAAEVPRMAKSDWASAGGARPGSTQAPSPVSAAIAANVDGRTRRPRPTHSGRRALLTGA